MNIFKEIEQATSDWKLAHGIKEQINAAAQELPADTLAVTGLDVPPLKSEVALTPMTSADRDGVCGSPLHSGPISAQQPASAAPLTFADIPLGSEFVCLEYGDDIVWEKCGETYAICYDMGHVDYKSTFKPTDRVRIK